MNQLLRLSLTLCIITAVAGFGLGLVYSATKDKIAESEARKTVEGLARVLPGYQVDPENVQTTDGVEYWIGQKEDGRKGYAFIAEKTGYSSDVQTMVGMDASGEILGIAVLSQQETPGLGARVQEVQSRAFLWQWLTGRLPEEEDEPSTPWFARQFKGLEARDIEIRKGKEWTALSKQEKQNLKQANAVTALSGATITTRTVTESIEEAAQVIFDKIQASQKKAVT